MKNNYREVLEKNGVVSFTPGGISMWPFIKNRGATVIIVKPEKELKRLDVALYERENGAAVLHRVMEVHKDCYYMCGDSQMYYETVPKDWVYGVLKGFYRGKKYIDCEKSKGYRLAVKMWTFSSFIKKTLLKISFKLKLVK